LKLRFKLKIKSASVRDGRYLDKVAIDMMFTGLDRRVSLAMVHL